MTKAHTEADARQALECIADLAGIPMSVTDEFISEAARAFHLAVKIYEDDRRRPRREKRLHRVALKAEALLRELKQLEDDARLQFGLHLIRFRRWGDTANAEEVRREISDLLDFGELANCDPAVAAAIKDVQAIENAAKTNEWPANPKGGRKKNQSMFDPEYGAFSRFVFDLQYAIVLSGGKTAFDKNMRSGSLVEILRTALPFLPNGIDAPIWLRDADSQSTSGADRIQTIKHKAEAFARFVRLADTQGFGLSAPL